MGYSITFDDITTLKVDAIVNSLGVDGNVYGKICKSIINAAKSKELKDFIDSKLNNKIGTIYFTHAGELPCNNIIHIVTPFKKDDDSNNTNLINAYKSVINKAIENKCKSIAVPFLGTGANGYDENDAYEAIRKVAGKIAELEDETNKKIIDILLVIYRRPKVVRNVEEDELEVYEIRSHGFEREYGNICRSSISGSISSTRDMNQIAKNVVKISELMGSLDEDNVFRPCSPKYKTPFDFVTEWLYDHDLEERDLVSQFALDKGKKSRIMIKEQLLKYEIYAFANDLQFSNEELLSLMIINGTCFNPQNKLDMFVVDYLLGKYGKLTPLEFSYKCYDKSGIWVSLANIDYYQQLKDAKLMY